jgi:actin, other eukaryote
MTTKSQEAAIVFDTGADSIKCGFSNEAIPKFILPSKIGHDTESDSILIGDDCTNISKAKSNIKFTYPIDRGFVRNWSHLESLYTHLYENCMKIESDDYPVITSEPPGTTRAQREKFAEIFFEKFKVPYLYLKNQAVLALHSYGQKTGLVADIGHSMSYVCAIVNGEVLNHSTERFNVGGRDITTYLSNYLNIEQHLSRYVKESCCYVSVDNFGENKLEENLNFTLPDGKILNLTPEQKYHPSEILFKPILIDIDIMGLHEIIYKTIAKTQIDLRRDLYANIYLSGGSSLLQDIEKRISYEVKQLAPKSVEVNVKIKDSREHASWIGGSLIAAMDSFKDECVSLSEYKENGPSILKKFC